MGEALSSCCCNNQDSTATSLKWVVGVVAAGYFALPAIITTARRSHRETETTEIMNKARARAGDQPQPATSYTASNKAEISIELHYLLYYFPPGVKTDGTSINQEYYALRNTQAAYDYPTA
jgi:hypothetical protein